VTELEAVLRREVSRAARYREELCLLLVDVPPATDVLERIRDGLRLCDAALAADGRVAVVLPETSLAGALQVAERLARGPSRSPGAPDAPGPAIGVGAYPSPSVADARSLLAAAGAALDRARRRGGIAI
jgi:GGDEF domain-containing protein